MKKLIFTFILLAFLSAGAFALDISVGGGANFDYSNNSGGSMSYGAHLFIDIKYVELSVNYSLGNFSSYDTHNLNFKLLGKYPINLGPLTIFPMVGGNYNMVLSAAEGEYKYPSPFDFNQFGLLFGAGADFNLSNALFVRATALWNIKFANKWISTISHGPDIKLSVGTKF